MEYTFVLIHSPLVGPLTWTPVARELRRRGIESRVPVLHDTKGSSDPFWQQHARDVARQLDDLPEDRLLVLVGHSGAGPLLPVIRQAAARPAAYVFVDAGIPVDGASRLDLMASEDPEFAQRFRQHLTAGGRFPAWSDNDLRGSIPDADLRSGMLRELWPRSLAFFAEPIPVFAGWPDGPCGYLKFSNAYDVPAEHARRLRWVFRSIPAGHFHMLNDPAQVASTLVDMIQSMRITRR